MPGRIKLDWDNHAFTISNNVAVRFEKQGIPLVKQRNTFVGMLWKRTKKCQSVASRNFVDLLDENNVDDVIELISFLFFLFRLPSSSFIELNYYYLQYGIISSRHQDPHPLF